MKLLIIILLFSINACTFSEGSNNMAENNLPNNVIQSKQVILDYQNQQTSDIETAISTINKYEQAEYIKYDRVGSDSDSSGMIENYHYKNIGLKIQKKDDLLINVETTHE